jgi:hypothetical protein
MEMPVQYEDVDVLCPFFKRQTVVSISCEGLTDDMGIKLCFQNAKAKDIHAEVFCNCKYKNCEIYGMVEKKYDE